MKKMFLASCILAASVFAFPNVENIKSTAIEAKPAVDSKVSSAKDKAAAEKAKAVDAKSQATANATAKVADVKSQAADVKSKATDAKSQATANATAKVADVKSQAADVKSKATDAKSQATANAAAKVAGAKSKAADAKSQATANATAKVADVKSQVADVKSQAADAKAAVADKATATENKANDVKSQVVETVAAPVATPAPEVNPVPAAEAVPAALPATAPVQAVAPAPVVIPAPAPVVETPAPVTEAPIAVENAPAEETASTEPVSTTSRKKKKMIENAVFTVNEIDFDINADFELEAGKVFWTSEDDVDMDNFEKWSGQANLAILAETKNFKGKIALAFYPGDLKTDNYNKDMGSAEDYFSLDEAWANQTNGWFSFKVGRWDNTDKNGDYFGGYIDGYMNGFLSTQDPENQFEFGFVPNENMDFTISLISKAAHLNKGDLRAVFNFHDLPSLELFEIQLGYRGNVFDKIYDTKAIIKHNISMKVRYPVVPDFFALFGEVALMDLSDELIVPFTAGFEMNFKTVDRVIFELEYVGDRKKNGYYEGNPKHVKDVLGALYLEKALTDRFSLSAGFHNYGASRDFMLSGNLIGRIN